MPRTDSRPYRRIEALLQVIGLVFLGLWVIWADPFGLSTASEKALATDISRSRAYVSPVDPAPITVVSIDYPSIKALHEADAAYLEADDWPLSYRDHARILSRLVSAGDPDDAPVAVFYDIFFERPRAASGDMAALGRVLARISDPPGSGERHPAVYLAGGGVQMPLSAESFDLLGGRGSMLATAAWQDHGDYYPLWAPLRPDDDASPLPATGPSAALALYRHLCPAQDKDCDWLEDGGAMSLQWVMRDDPACSDRWTHLPGYVIKTVLRYAGAGDPPGAADPHCMPFHQVRLQDLFAMPAGGLRPPHLPKGAPYVVLVGAVMPSLNDYHDTPLYEKVAGVYLHAMAVENLNRMDSDFLREQNIRGVSSVLWVLIALFVCLRRHRARRRTAPASAGPAAPPEPTFRDIAGRRLRALGSRAGWVLLMIVLITLIYLFCYSVLDIALEGWLFMIGLVSLLLFSKDEPTDRPDP